jgi:hypothetical protein
VRVARIEEFFNEYGEGRREDMDLDLEDPDKYLLVQSSPRDDEPWYVLLASPDEAVQYIRQDYPAWEFVTLVDLDTGEEFDLVTEYSFKSKVTA